MDLKRILENHALAFAAPLRFDDDRGFDNLTVVARLTWQIDADGKPRLAPKQRPIRITDKRHGRGSLRFVSDECAEKPGTDVMMLAQAHPPDGTEVRDMDVGLRVETGERTIQKMVRVYGPRVFMKKLARVAPGPAQPLVGPLPLVYEYARGGREVTAGAEDLVDPINPVGLGMAKDPSRLVGTEAYRIEPVGGSEPAGFAPIAKPWRPRLDRYGTVDDAYWRRRHPVPPKDFDPRFNCASHPDLYSETPLRGDEPIEVVGATPEGVWRFQLPYYEPHFEVRMDGESERYPTHLDTLMIDLEHPDERIVELTWRISVRLPRKPERLEKIVMTNAQDVPREYYEPIWEGMRRGQRAAGSG